MSAPTIKQLLAAYPAQHVAAMLRTGYVAKPGYAPPKDYTQKARTTARIQRNRVRLGGNQAIRPGPTPVIGRANTWRWYMCTLARAYPSVDAAEAAHKATGQYANNRIDWNWLVKQSYIIYGTGE